MKPLRLELRGFTSFREPQTLDFTGRKLFVITGPTGAGKSSILDAITWALYGQVPRVGRSVRELVTHGEAAMAVRLDFEARGRCYRVSRRAPGTTATRLERHAGDGTWEPLADRATDVTERVTRILGMDYVTFTKTIVLPQGAFDAFLKGEVRDRRQILTNLLGLSIYEDARGIAHQRASAARQRVESTTHQLQQLELASPKRVAELEAERIESTRALEAMQERRTALHDLGELTRAQHEAAQGATRAAEQAAAAQGDAEEARGALAKAVARLGECERRIAALEAERTELRYDPEAHEALRWRVRLLRQREETQAQVTAAQREQEEAHGALASAREAEQAARAAAQAAERVATEAHATFDTARSALSAAATGASAAREATQREAMEAEIGAREHEQRAASAEERTRELEAQARVLAEARATLERSAAALAAAQKQVSEAEATARSALEARDAAQRAVEERRTAFEEARAHDAAAALRAGLKPGDPCPVCGEPIGSLFLPKPESAGDIEAARAALAEAERALEEHRAVSEQASAAAAAARSRVEQHVALEDEARARVEALEAPLSDAGVDGDPTTEVERERAAASEARTQAATLLDAARAARDRAQALDVALARVPAEVLADASGLAAAAADRPDLESAVAEHAGAAEVARQAADTHRRALDQVSRAASDVTRAEQEVARANARLEEAQRRLAGLGDEPEGDAEALSRSLAEWEERRRRERAIEEALSTARSELAAATEARSSAEAARGRLETRAAEQDAAARTAREAATEAERVFTEAWSTVIGEGEPSLRTLKEVMDAHAAEQTSASQRAGALDAQIEQARKDATTAAAMTREIEEQRGIADLAGALARELQGNHFVAYVQGEAMRLLAADASERLAQLTAGRYALHAESDTFAVIDHLNGDERRSVKTLSGGETFLASLALALALSEHLPELSGTGGAMSLESLFLDEGFGALDIESLDLAVQGLETLATGQRMIGVISHVEEVAERLPDRIRVVKRGDTSVIEEHAAG